MMYSNLRSDTFARLQRAITNNDNPTIIVELRTITFAIEQSLQHNMQQLQTMMPTNEIVSTIIDGLDTNPFTTRIHAAEIPEHITDPTHVVKYYQEIWDRRDWSSAMILENLVNANRSTIASLQGYLNLFRHAITQDVAPLYQTITDDVAYMARVRDYILRYLHS